MIKVKGNWNLAVQNDWRSFPNLILLQRCNSDEISVRTVCLIPFLSHGNSLPWTHHFWSVHFQLFNHIYARKIADNYTLSEPVFSSVEWTSQCDCEDHSQHPESHTQVIVFAFLNCWLLQALLHPGLLILLKPPQLSMTTSSFLIFPCKSILLKDQNCSFTACLKCHAFSECFVPLKKKKKVLHENVGIFYILLRTTGLHSFMTFPIMFSPEFMS